MPTFETNRAPIPYGLPVERDAGPFDPPRRITRLREARPVSPMAFPDGHEGWIVTGYDTVRQLMADTRFSSRQDIDVLHVPYEIPGMPAVTEPSPQVPGLFIAMDPPDHTRLRRRLTGAFTVKRMKQLEQHIVDLAERQLDEMARLSPPVDLVKEFALPVPSLVICELLGVPYADRAEFQVDSAKFLNKELPFDEQIAAYTGLTTYLAELVARQRAAPGDDLLSDLARHDELTIEELTGIAFLLLLAGHETTANMLGLGTFALRGAPRAACRTARRPRSAARRRRGAPALPVRCGHPLPLRHGGHRARRRNNRQRINRRRLHAGRQPRPPALRQPRHPDIRRNARGHLSFGHGVHQCLGQQLARIEMRAGFAGLLRRFPTLKLAITADEVKLRTNMQIYGVHELPVT
jgi:cytochrome P450